MTKGGTGSQRRAFAAARKKRIATAKELNELASKPTVTPTGTQGQQNEEAPSPNSRDVRLLSAPFRRAIFRLFRRIWNLVEIFALLLSFVGVTYLVYDSYYQTKITADFAYSDPVTALDNPISLRNNSNLFTIRNINWDCVVKEANFEHIHFKEDLFRSSGNISEILPGGVLNISCGISHLIALPPKLIDAVIDVRLGYDAQLGPLSLHRNPDPLSFTWVGSIASPHWLRGVLP